MVKSTDATPPVEAGGMTLVTSCISIAAFRRVASLIGVTDSDGKTGMSILGDS